jgi:hypothetical protein
MLAAKARFFAAIAGEVGDGLAMKFMRNQKRPITIRKRSGTRAVACQPSETLNPVTS